MSAHVLALLTLILCVHFGFCVLELDMVCLHVRLDICKRERVCIYKYIRG